MSTIYDQTIFSKSRTKVTCGTTDCGKPIYYNTYVNLWVHVDTGNPSCHFLAHPHANYDKEIKAKKEGRI